MTSYTEAIKRELKQLNDYGQISEIKETELNSTILSHLEMSNDLVDAVKTDWNAKGIFKSLLIKSQALFENFCEVILWHNSKTASSAGQKESRNRRNDYSFCSRLRRCAFTLP